MHRLPKVLISLSLSAFFLFGSASLFAAGSAVERSDEKGKPLNVLLMIGSHEYEIDKTLPRFAEDYLSKLNCKVTTIKATQLKTGYGKDKAEFPGFTEAVPNADVIILGVRRRQVTTAVMEAFKAHLKAGKGLVSVRVSVAAFQPIPLIKSSKRRKPVDPPEGYAKWDYFGKEVLACSYAGHDQRVAFEMTVPEAAKDHPILKNVTLKTGSHIYYIAPLLDGAQPLLQGVSNSSKAKRDGQAGIAHPVVWTYHYGENKAPIVGMANGTPEDFKKPNFNVLLTNALFWAGNREVPVLTEK